MVGGVAGVLGRASARLPAPLPHKQVGRCCTLAAQPARSRECPAPARAPAPAGDRYFRESRGQERLWRQFFQDPTLWWDNRQAKKSLGSPDFRHRQSHEVLWLNNFYKPDWVDVRVAALDMDMGMVKDLCHEGHLAEAVEALERLVRTGHCISKSVLYTVLNRCVVKKDLVLGRRVHALTVMAGYQSDTFLGFHILRMYASHGRLQDAMDVFLLVAEPDTFTWSSIISAHVKQGQDKQAIQLYHGMCRSGVKPDCHVFVAALQACGRQSDLKTGQQVHADLLASGVEPDLFVCNSLVNMYAKCGSLEDARGVFDGLGQKNVVTWTALIAGYSQQGKGQEALALYSAMQQEGLAVPNSVTFVCLLQACASVGPPALDKGRHLHSQIRERGHQADLFVANCLVSMYAKCGSLEDAHRVFDTLGHKDVVTWNTIIGGYSQQGMGQEALCLYSAMQEEGLVVPDSVTFVSLLQACASVGAPALVQGKELHAQITARGLQADVFVSNSMVNMYSKCGSLEDAQRVFDRLGEKNVVTWTAMISGYSQQGMGHESLQLYSDMQEAGLAVPNSVTFVSLLQACASVGSLALDKGKHLHWKIGEQGHQADVLVANSLVNMYAKCGSLEDAQRVFDALVHKDVVTWNALIGGYSQQGMGQEALRLYNVMQEDGISLPDATTFMCLLQACAIVGAPALEKGRQLHSEIRERGHQADVFIVNSLINMYAKCGSLEDARRVFDNLGPKNEVTWTTMIAGYSQQGLGQEALCLYRGMQEQGMASPNSVTLVCLLQACAAVGTPALEKGKQLHMQVRDLGYEADMFVASSLVNMYTKCGSMPDAQRVFEGLDQKSVVTWNAMMAGYSQQGLGQQALHLYRVMLEGGTAVPNSVTFVCLLQACATLGTPALDIGKLLHVQITEQGHQGDLFVASSLVNMYAKCGCLEDAHKVFDRLSKKDVVTWNAMIAGYCQQGMSQEALRLYRAMEEEGIAIPDSVTFACLLQACASMGTQALEMGKQLHAQIREQEHQDDVFVASSLVDMYAKCGNLLDAQRVFDGLSHKDVVMWNAMIAGFCQQGMCQEALRLYNSMQENGTAVPDSVTFACVLQACADLAALYVGRQLHAQIVRQGLQADVLVAGSLINMYGKSGSIVDAQQVFDTMPEKNIVSWSALIAGYTSQGDSEVVFDLVERMGEDGVHPDGITFLSVLTVCSHAGLVNQGLEYFETMSSHYTPTEDHYTCMVDLLGRAGQLDEALAFVSTMPVPPNGAVWHALLGACQKWSNVEVGRHAFNEAIKLDDKDTAAYVLMSNIYTGAQMWEEAEKLQGHRKTIRAWKQPGETWWTDKDGAVHSFVAGDEKHSRSLATLKHILSKLKTEEYVPYLD